MCENCVCETYSKKLSDKKVDLLAMEPILEKYRGIPGSLINILQEVQEAYGFLPLSALNMIAQQTGNSKSTIYGVATFYAQFRLKPIGKYLILQCQGTACHVNGSKEISKAISEELGINPGETTEDGLFTVEDVACLGCCSLAPVIMINGEAYGNLTPKKVVEVIRKIREAE